MADHWLLTTPQPALPTLPTSVSFLPSDPFPASSPREPLSRHGQWRSLSLPASPLLSPRTQLPATPLHLDVLPARPVHCLIFLKLCHATFTSALQCRVFRLGTVSVLNPGGRVSVPTPCPRDRQSCPPASSEPPCTCSLLPGGLPVHILPLLPEHPLLFGLTGAAGGRGPRGVLLPLGPLSQDEQSCCS